MSRDNSPPFPRGGKWGSSESPDGDSFVGREFQFEDIDYSAAGPKPVRSNRPVTVRCVRDSCTVDSGGEAATGALLPKKLVTFKAGTYNREVDGYARLTAVGPCYPVDEFLPAAGVANGELFYIVTKGPAMCL